MIALLEFNGGWHSEHVNESFNHRISLQALRNSASEVMDRNHSNVI